MTCSVSCYRTWDEKPHGDSAVSVSVRGHTVVRPSVLSPHPTDLQGWVGEYLDPPGAGPDSTTRSAPGQVMPHRAFNLAGEHRHASHRGSHVHCPPQDWRRLCFSGNIKLLLSAVNKQCRKCFCWQALHHVDVLALESKIKKKMSGTYFKVSLWLWCMQAKHLRRCVFVLCVCVCVCGDIPLTVSSVKARPCPALLCAMHSYRPSSSADACAISHDAMAEFLLERHARSVGLSVTAALRSYSRITFN